MPLTIQHAKSNTIGDMTGTVSVFNSSGGTATVAATNLVRPSDWNSAHNVTYTPSASELSDIFEVEFFEPFALPSAASTLSAPGVGTWYLDPFSMPMILSSGHFKVPVAAAAGFLGGAVYSATNTGSASKVQTFHHRLAIYSMGHSGSGTSLGKVWEGGHSQLFTHSLTVSSTATNDVRVSNYITASLPYKWDSSGGVTYSNFTTSGTILSAGSTMASTRANSLLDNVAAMVSGSRFDVIPFQTSLAPGQYVMAHMMTSTSSTAGAGGNYGAGTMIGAQSVVGMNDMQLSAFKLIGASSVGNTISAPQLFHGYLNTVSSSASSGMGTADMRPTVGRMYWNFNECATS